ncbi:MAG: hypothetical protein AAF916_09320 [Planctomycetota bacterium]
MSKKRISVLSVTAAGMLTAALALPVSGQQVIASQDFEGSTLSRGIPAESTAVTLGFYDDVTGIYTMPGLSSDPSDPGLGFTHSTNASTPEGVTQGGDAGDVIGVFGDDVKDFGTSNGLASAANRTGQFYLVEDADST